MYQIKAQGGRTLELLIYDSIGDAFMSEGVTAKRIAADLKLAGALDQIDVRINSDGGSAPEAFAIYNLLTRQRARVDTFIDGAALSAASVIAMAGQTVTAAENSIIMIHEPYSAIVGDAAELRTAAEALDRVGENIARAYAAHAPASTSDAMRALMRAETWLTADEAQNLGIVDNVGEARSMAAHWDPKRFPHVPEWARERLMSDGNYRERLKKAELRLVK